MKRNALVIGASAIGSLIIFAATLYPYFERHRLGTAPGYLPLALGLVAICTLSGMLSFASLTASPSRLWVSVATSVGVGISFVFLFFLLVLNTLGS
jgi:hypothetical protein